VAASLYVITPRAQCASYFGAEVFARSGFRDAQGIADLTAVTVAAMAPSSWDVSLCDEHVSAIDFAHPASFIAITGKITQAARMLEVAAEFRRRGKTVLMGGPCVSLSPEAFRGRCDVLVIGELESIARDLFADLERGSSKPEYAGAAADLAATPMPRWDLYPTERALSGTVQTSRGCPFECEFCDVIQYLGRRQRFKPIPQILAELDVLYRCGFRTIFLADDNFSVHRRHAKEILAALAEWNRSRADGAVAFNTQVSIDTARDPELLQMLSRAGMRNVFVGIETSNQESLKEARKRQNVGVDLLAGVRQFLTHGISVTSGMIVGFDHDGLDIFDRQFEFAMASPIPIFSLGALVAPAATPLYERLRDAGRLIPDGHEVAGSPWDTNIVPARMTRDELMTGLRRLSRDLYTPANFGQRVLQMIDALQPAIVAREPDGAARRAIDSEAMLVIRAMMERGPEERRMMAAVTRRLQHKPSARRPVLQALFRYAQVRTLHESAAVAAVV